MTTQDIEALTHLVVTIENVIDGLYHRHDLLPAVLDAAVVALGTVRIGVADPEFRATGKEMLSACALLDPIFATADNTPHAPVVTALARARGWMRWMQNPGYRNQPAMKQYLGNSAFCEITGARGLVASKQAAVGFFLMGPGVHYPNHAHPAMEVYVVLSGRADWKRDGEDWISRPAGAVVYHPSAIGHAARTHSEPLLALYLWHGDLVTLPRPLPTAETLIDEMTN